MPIRLISAAIRNRRRRLSGKEHERLKNKELLTNNCNHNYKLASLQGIPNEIFYNIMDYLLSSNAYRSILELSSTCKCISFRLPYSIIYNDVELLSPYQFNLFSETVKINKEIANTVETITFIKPRKDNQPESIGNIGYSVEFEKYSDQDYIILIVKCLNNVKTINFKQSSRFFNFENCLKKFISMINKKKFLQNLTTIDISIEDGWLCIFNIKTLEKLSNFKSIFLNRICIDDTEAITELNSTNCITKSLTLQSCVIPKNSTILGIIFSEIESFTICAFSSRDRDLSIFNVIFNFPKIKYLKLDFKSPFCTQSQSHSHPHSFRNPNSMQNNLSDHPSFNSNSNSNHSYLQNYLSPCLEYSKNNHLSSSLSPHLCEIFNKFSSIPTLEIIHISNLIDICPEIFSISKAKNDNENENENIKRFPELKKYIIDFAPQYMCRKNVYFTIKALPCTLRKVFPGKEIKMTFQNQRLVIQIMA